MKKVDIVLIGGGIMSATLGTFLHSLQPDASIEIFERLGEVALESSHVLNNAGTGHSAFCELNYTPQLADGSIAIHKALAIAESFEISKQFWSYLVEGKKLSSPQEFINSVPHLSWGVGSEQVAYLRKRFTTLQQHSLFKGIEYSDSVAQLKKWIPLMLEGRKMNDVMAATYMGLGTDVNFSSLTRSLFDRLITSSSVALHTSHEVSTIQRNSDGYWEIFVIDKKTGEKRIVTTKFVFIGAGGGAVTLLQKSGIPEGKLYGGFPINGNLQKMRYIGNTFQLE